MEHIEVLNGFYKPLCRKCDKIQNILKEHGYNSKMGFFNNHSVKDENGDWITEHYPIIIVTVEQLCDIGIDINDISIETIMTRENALKFDFTLLSKYKFEIYGADSFLNDFYNDELKIDDIVRRIQISDEKEIGISFSIRNDYLNEILEIVTLLDTLNTYIN